VEVNWRPKIPKPFHPLYTTTIDEIIARSGRVSGKSYAFRDYCFGKLLEKKGNHIVVTRAEGNDIRRTVFAMFEALVAELNLERFFKFNKSPFEITYLPYGNKIFFEAINGDINRTKGFTIPHGRIAVVWHEEAQEMDSEIYIDGANTTFVRFFDQNSKTLYAYNPPEIASHWANIWFPKKVQLGDALEIYSTWEDIRNLLTAQTIKKIIQMQRNDPDYYKYWYLGHIISLRGLVFRQFKKEKHVIKHIDLKWLEQNAIECIIAVDGAIKNDSTAVGIGVIVRDGRMIELASYYYDPIQTGQQLADIDQARKIAKWFGEFFQRYPFLQFLKHWLGTVDNANFDLLLMLRQMDEFKWFPWRAATDKNIYRDTKRLQNMFEEDLIFILDNEHDRKFNQNYIGISQFQSYVYDVEKNNEIKKNQEDHYIDMMKYQTYHYRSGTAFVA
jgi:phage terminase large subunit